MASATARSPCHNLVEGLTQEMEEACDDLVDQYWQMGCQLLGTHNDQDTVPELWNAVLSPVPDETEEEPPGPFSFSNDLCRWTFSRFTQDLPPSKCRLRNARKKDQTRPQVHWQREQFSLACLTLQHKQGSQAFRFFWSDYSGKGCDPKHVLLADNREWLALCQWTSFLNYDSSNRLDRHRYNRSVTEFCVRQRLRLLKSNNNNNNNKRLEAPRGVRMPLVDYESPWGLIYNDPGTMPELKRLFDGFKGGLANLGAFKALQDALEAKAALERRIYPYL